MNNHAPAGRDMNRKKLLFGILRIDLLVIFASLFVGLLLFSNVISRPLAWMIGAVILVVALVLMLKRSE